ncbi:hypothetical protein TIFTF001_028004 [Ficus carica]|uniref:ABC-2 type transporter transmembrane domain-containing protein n=1 Tax=Ficus carica TaxID=3494 RepID=A0AA88DP33_FICCA|nr:hypothetical protein TIFTF001_028004 [Ficus carica]
MIGNTISAQPYLLLISLIPGALTYYLPGLRKDYKHFLYFIFVLYVCMMLVESLMMIVASLVPNFLMGRITGSGIQGFMILGGGFFRLPRDLPGPFWRYPLFYVAFHRYAYQGLFKNEFEGLVLPNVEGGASAFVTGEEILRSQWQVDISYSKWVDLAVYFGMVVFYRVLFLKSASTRLQSCWIKSGRAKIPHVEHPRHACVECQPASTDQKAAGSRVCVPMKSHMSSFSRPAVECHMSLRPHRPRRRGTTPIHPELGAAHFAFAMWLSAPELTTTDPATLAVVERKKLSEGGGGGGLVELWGFKGGCWVLGRLNPEAEPKSEEEKEK